jgi:cytidine deaminase
LQQEGQIAVDVLNVMRFREQEQMSFIGTLLVADGMLTHDGLTELLNLALARWLDQAGLFTDHAKQLFEERNRGVFWGERLLDEGVLSEEQLAEFYVRSCGIPYIQLSGYRVPKEAAEILPREAAVASGVLPIAKEGTRITVATFRPADSRLVEEVAAWTGCEVRTVLAMRDQLLEALGTVYVSPRVEAEAAVSSAGPTVPPVAEPDATPPLDRVLPGTAESHELAWLLHAAKAMTKNAYAPHSNLRVGAAVLADNGEVFAGCNVENDSFGLSMCAERVAIFKAVSGGRRSIKAVAVVADGLSGIRPCGACLQVVYQFGPEAVFVFESAAGGMETRTMSELLPHAFALADKEG